ncbi:MAG: DUF4407 domain-containing protein [Bacteroidetes bacterium]|nr:DUF4407 domain-containing protein [Bacteroidota bacterium]
MNLRKFLCTLSGDDYSIISQCDNAQQNRFAAIGGFVFCIFVLCFLSSYITFTMLFQNYYIGVLASIFFSWMITNIYLLLLYTLTKNVLPHLRNDKARVYSAGVRLGFICFLAIVVSKPLESWLYSDQLDIEISIYKQAKIKKYTKITSDYFEQETEQLKLIIDRQTKLYGSSPTGKVDLYVKLLEKKEDQRQELIARMENLVEHSNFYIRSIIMLNTKHPSCWLFTFVSIIIFMIPAYLKNFLGEQSSYYDLKRRIEITLIQQEYATFKSHYNRILQSLHSTNKTFSECYIDAPFNTIRKKDGRQFLKEDDLISELYND